jgi:hypothetical protein
MPKDSNNAEQGWIHQAAFQTGLWPAFQRAPKENMVIPSGYSVSIPGDYEIVSGFYTDIAQDSLLAIG